MHGTHLAARKLQRIRAHAGAAFLALAVCGLGAAPARAEAIKVGTTKLSSTAPLFIAIDKGYFAAEGLAAEVVIFDAAQPVSMGVTSGDLDFGVTAVSGPFAEVVISGHVLSDVLRLRMAEAGADFFYGHEEVRELDDLLAVIRSPEQARRVQVIDETASAANKRPILDPRIAASDIWRSTHFSKMPFSLP